ncbi:hypothetical protein LBMAG42_29770 [Deltaproteobacteria bacterium]|nr:hypothetical protein LBMAG42_29770 [Deltaproteobacteria bacterium]
MNTALHAAIAAGTLLVPTVLVTAWVEGAKDRLEEAEAAPSTEPAAAVSASADVDYCSASLKKVLRRVLQSCGLAGAAGGRGCQPADAKALAGGDTAMKKGEKKAGTVSGDDFNALFMPLADRAGILQFDKDSSELDASDLALLDHVFAEQKGASYFFIVARSSPEGSVEHNRSLSQARAESALTHLRTTFKDPDLDKEVGLLWLGEEFAQLDDEFCKWQRSGATETCQPEELNRSAFVAWIDCTL